MTFWYYCNRHALGCCPPTGPNMVLLPSTALKEVPAEGLGLYCVTYWSVIPNWVKEGCLTQGGLGFLWDWNWNIEELSH